MHNLLTQTVYGMSHDCPVIQIKALNHILVVEKIWYSHFVFPQTLTLGHFQILQLFASLCKYYITFAANIINHVVTIGEELRDQDLLKLEFLGETATKYVICVVVPATMAITNTLMGDVGKNFKFHTYNTIVCIHIKTQAWFYLMGLPLHRKRNKVPTLTPFCQL